MALSGSVSTNKYDERYYELSWTATQSIANNTSTIKWTLSAKGDAGSWYAERTLKVVIAGQTVYSKTARVERYDGTVATGSLTVTHDNTGNKSFKVNIEAAIYVSSINATAEKTFTLDQIPRYGTSVQSLNTKTETTIKMNWSSDSTVDSVWYSTDNGTSWTNVAWNSISAKSGTYTISGLSPKTTYKIKTRIKRKDSQLKTDSSALSVATYDYPHCTNAPDFVLGSPVTLTFYNPLEREFDFSLTGNGKHIYNWTGNTGTSYKGVNGEPALTNLYDSISSLKKAKYSVETVYNDNFILVDGGTYSIDESKCQPTFKTFTYKDTNTTVTNVTGNNQVLVKGLSKLTVEISATNKMVALNGATPKNYVASIDTLSVPFNYSESAISKEIGKINTVKSPSETKRLTVTAYDSRTLFKSAYKDITVYDYNAPKINVSVKRKNNFEALTTLSVSGEYTRLTINGADKNTVSKVEYHYREVGTSTWSSWTALTTTLSSGKFTCSNVTLTLDNTKAYEFEVKATDKLSPHTQSAKVDIGQAIFFISTNKRTCFVNNEEIATKDYVGDVIASLFPSGASVTNALYPVGSVIITSTNTNPSATHGGTWELKNKGFISLGDGGTKYFTANSNITTYNCYIVRNGKSLRIRLEFTPAVDITDTGMELGTLNLSEMGTEGFNVNYLDILGGSDGGNCACTFRISSAGVVTVSDIVGLNTFPKGQACYIDFTTPLTPSRMLDNACNEFYWLRTK